MSPVIEALIGNTSVTELSFRSWNWKREDLGLLVEVLSSCNEGLIKIEFNRHDFKPDFIEEFKKILKNNTCIKTIDIIGQPYSFSDQGWILFCNGISQYNFEELLFSNARISALQYCRLFNQLQYTGSIKKLQIGGDTLDKSAIMTLAHALLVNPKITDLTLCELVGDPASFAKFIEMIQANSLSKLTFCGTDLTNFNFRTLAEELKNNASITDLTVQNCIVDWEIFGEIVRENTTIEKLSIHCAHITHFQLRSFNLGSNTTLKELELVSCYQLEDYSTIFSELRNNTTITRLTIGVLSHLDFAHKALRDFIEQNYTIVALNIQTDKSSIHDNVFRAVVDGLKVNRTITALGLGLTKANYQTFTYFLDVLKSEDSNMCQLRIPKLSSIRLEKVPDDAPLTLVNWDWIW